MDTQIYDNYLFQESLDKTVPDSDNVIFKQKLLTPTFDNQRGSGDYTSGRVIIDSQATNGDDRSAHSEAYTTFPVILKTEMKTLGSATPLTTISALPVNRMAVLKNNALIESFRLDQAGNTIVNDTQNTAHLINFVKHCTTSVDNLEKMTAITGYYPDSVGFWDATAGTISSIGISNCANEVVGLTGGSERYNSGLLKRQQFISPAVSYSNNNVLTTAGQRKEELDTIQTVASASTALTATYTTVSELHTLVVVKDSDVSDFLAKHPLMRGLGYKRTYSLNQGACEMTFACSADADKPFGATPTTFATTLMAQATAFPAMFSCGPNSLVKDVALSATSGTLTGIMVKLTCKIDTDATNALQTGVIGWTPSYILTDESESKLMALQKVHRAPFKTTSNVFNNLTKNASIQQQLFTAITNPRLLVLCPQIHQGSQISASQWSPLNPCPATTDPCLSLTKIQIRVNNKTILPSPQSYSYQQFIENTSRVLSLNGGSGPVSSGLIDFFKFKNNYRYYAFDLSNLPDSQRDVPQIIAIEAFNNNNVAIDLYCFCLSEQSATFDMIKGGVDIM